MSYIYVRDIGRGGQAVVRLFYDEANETHFAIKEFISPHSFQVEKEALEAQYGCSNIVQLYLYNTPVDTMGIPSSILNPSRSLALVHYTNGDLERFMKKLEHTSLGENMAKTLLKQIITACKNLHDRGYTHRDIKLDNIFLDDRYCPHIGDFGLATKDILIVGNVGTNGHMAPEMFSGSHYDGPKVDVWAIGVLYFIMLTGFYPFGTKENFLHKNWFLQLKLNKTEAFWDYHQQHSPQPISLGARDFLEKIFVLDPVRRIGIDEILEDNYLMADILPDDEAFMVMESLNRPPQVQDGA